MTQNRPLMANRVFHVLVVAVMVVTFVWPSVSWGGEMPLLGRGSTI